MAVPEDGAMMPLPPPFMWACRACTMLMDTLTDAFDLSEVDPYYDGAVRAQIALCRHVVVEHPSEVPEPHDDGCEICAHYERDPQAALVWAEHRARGLFLPPDSARLL